MDWLPELHPTRQIDDMRSEFLLPWHKPLDVLSHSPVRILAQLSIACSTAGISEGELAKDITERQGNEPINILSPTKSPLIGFAPNWLVPSGLAEATTDTDRVLRFRATEAGQQCLPLLGALALWQLRHAIPLRQIMGSATQRYSDLEGPRHPYTRASTGRLRTLQALLYAGRPMSTPEIGNATMGMPSEDTYKYKLYEAMVRDGLIQQWSKANPAHRKIALNVTPTSSRQTKAMSPVKKAFYNAAVSLHQQGKLEVSGTELLAEAKKWPPASEASDTDLWRAFGRHPLSVARFADEALFGASTGNSHNKAVYALEDNMRESVYDLLVSICSLQDVSYRHAANEIAKHILDNKDFVCGLVRAWVTRPYNRKTPDSPIAEPTVISDSDVAAIGGILARTHEKVPAVHDQATALRNVSYLLEGGVIKLARTSLNGAASLVFSPDIRATFEPAELRALAYVLRIQSLLYSNALGEADLRASLKLPYSVSLSDYAKRTLLPRLNVHLSVAQSTTP